MYLHPIGFIQLVNRRVRDASTQPPDGQWLLDAEWKLLDQTDHEGKFGLSQAHLGGRGDVALVYPLSPRLSKPTAPFHFSADLRLHVLPFDLDQGRLLGGERLRLPWHTERIPEPA